MFISNHLLLEYKNIFGFHMLTTYPTTLINSHISSREIYFLQIPYEFLHNIISSVFKNSLTFSSQFLSLFTCLTAPWRASAFTVSPHVCRRLCAFTGAVLVPEEPSCPQLGLGWLPSHGGASHSCWGSFDKDASFILGYSPGESCTCDVHEIRKVILKSILSSTEMNVIKKNQNISLHLKQVLPLFTLTTSYNSYVDMFYLIKKILISFSVRTAISQ